MRHPFLIILAAFGVFVLGSILYVPWVLTFNGGQTHTAYDFIFRPPTQGYLHDWSRVKIDAVSHRIDWGTLVDEWVVLGTGIACSYPVTQWSTKKTQRA